MTGLSEHQCSDCPYVGRSARGLAVHCGHMHGDGRIHEDREGASGSFADPREVTTAGPDFDGGVFSLGDT